MTGLESSAASGTPTDDRPPIGAVPALDAAEPFQRLRPTVFVRPLVTPIVWNDYVGVGFPVTHPYVRRYWTPVLGPGAVADLLRLATAAARGCPLPRPLYLSELIKAAFVSCTADGLRVRTHVPAVPLTLARRLPPQLQRELHVRPSDLDL